MQQPITPDSATQAFHFTPTSFFHHLPLYSLLFRALHFQFSAYQRAISS